MTDCTKRQCYNISQSKTIVNIIEIESLYDLISSYFIYSQIKTLNVVSTIFKKYHLMYCKFNKLQYIQTTNNPTFIGKYKQIPNIKVTIPKYIGQTIFQLCKHILFLDISNCKSITLKQFEECMILHMPLLTNLRIFNSQVEDDFYSFGPTIKNNTTHTKFTKNENQQFMKQIYNIPNIDQYKKYYDQYNTLINKNLSIPLNINKLKLVLDQIYNFIKNINLNFYNESLIGSKLEFNFIKIPLLIKHDNISNPFQVFYKSIKYKNKMNYVSLIILKIFYKNDETIKYINSIKQNLFKHEIISEYNSIIYNDIQNETIMNYIIDKKSILICFYLVFIKSLNYTRISGFRPHESELDKCRFILTHFNTKCKLYLHESYYKLLYNTSTDFKCPPVNIIYSLDLSNKNEYICNYEIGFIHYKYIDNNIKYKSIPSINIVDYNTNKVTIVFTDKEFELYKCIEKKRLINIQDLHNINTQNRVYAICMNTGAIILSDIVYILQNNIDSLYYHIINNLFDITPTSTWDLFLNLFINSNTYISNMCYLLIQLKNRIKYKHILPFNYLKDEPNIKRLLSKLIDILKNFDYNDLIQKRYNFNSKIIQKSIIEMLPIEMNNFIINYCEKKEYTEFLEIYKILTISSKIKDSFPINMIPIVNKIIDYDIFTGYNFMHPSNHYMPIRVLDVDILYLYYKKQPINNNLYEEPFTKGFEQFEYSNILTLFMYIC